MKKFKLSALLVLSLAGLTACGSGEGLVKNGVAYNRGDAAKINETVKAEKDGKVKVVTEKATVEMSLKMKMDGQSMNMKEKADGIITVDVPNKTVDIKLDASMEVGKEKITEKVSVKAEEKDGEFVITSSTGGEMTGEEVDVEQIANYFETASYSIYSWNYDDSDTAYAAATESLSDYADSDEVLGLIKKMESKIKIAGEVETGNFEIGLSEPFSIKIGNYPITYTKLKSVYKDGLVQSTVVGVKMSANQNGSSMSLSMTSANEFSYTF